MPAKYKLSYFNGKGSAEASRLIFAQAGVEYEDKRFEREEWNGSIKATSPTGQVPMLEVDGKVFVQSIAIARYLARQFGLAGKTPLDEFQADMVVDTVADMIKPLQILFGEQDPEKKAAGMKKFGEEQLPASLQNLEKLLLDNKGGNGYFVGSEVTWADLYFMHCATFPALVGATIDWCKYPKLKALDDRVKKLPKIAKWLEKRPKTQF